MLIKTDYLQILIYLLTLAIFIKPLGLYIARVYEGRYCGLDHFLSPLERGIYHLCAISPQQEMDWKNYLSSMLIFNLFGILVVYALQRFQYFLILNPQHFPGIPPDLAFNTAVSFVTNTNWQAYAGENTMSYFTQTTALTVQNFLSAATGMSLLMAVIRGFFRHETSHLGNFWRDTVRGILYILLPLSLLWTVVLASQGVIQNIQPYQKVQLIQPLHTPSKEITEQIIPMGLVASQVAIKELGTNGGGFFGTNSAHPFENPTPFSNFIEMLAILLIPSALCYTYGKMVNDLRQGRALLFAMSLILIPCIFATTYAEEHENPIFKAIGLQGGNMEGKETRLGIVNSALWATITTATSNGSVNSMHDSFTPLGGLVPLWLIHLGEVIFGGVGSGLYGMLMFVILTVFIAGLMIGRTPEYLGKKIEAYEMKMACLAVLLMPLFVLVFTGIASVTHNGTDAISNPGAHGLTQMLYAFTSMVNNNGSAFAGLNANTPFYKILGGIAIMIGRYWIAIPTLAIAGSMARKRISPTTSGTLPTHTPLFVLLLIGVIFILGALSFLPVLALGPIADHLMLGASHVL